LKFHTTIHYLTLTTQQRKKFEEAFNTQRTDMQTAKDTLENSLRDEIESKDATIVQMEAEETRARELYERCVCVRERERERVLMFNNETNE